MVEDRTHFNIYSIQTCYLNVQKLIYNSYNILIEYTKRKSILDFNWQKHRMNFSILHSAAYSFHCLQEYITKIACPNDRIVSVQKQTYFRLLGNSWAVAVWVAIHSNHTNNWRLCSMNRKLKNKLYNSAIQKNRNIKRKMKQRSTLGEAFEILYNVTKMQAFICYKR